MEFELVRWVNLEICKLSSIDNCFQDTSIVNDTNDEPSVNTSYVNVEDDILRKRRSLSKDNNVYDAQQQQQPLVIENVDRDVVINIQAI